MPNRDATSVKSRRRSRHVERAAVGAGELHPHEEGAAVRVLELLALADRAALLDRNPETAWHDAGRVRAGQREHAVLARRRGPCFGGAVGGHAASRRREPLPAPRLGLLQLVEGEDVEAVPGWCRARPKLGASRPTSRSGLVAAGQEEPPEHALLLLQEPGRLAEAEPGRDADELLPADDPGQADADRELDAAGLRWRAQPDGGRGVEAELGDDVGGVAAPSVRAPCRSARR